MEDMDEQTQEMIDSKKRMKSTFPTAFDEAKKIYHQEIKNLEWERSILLGMLWVP